MKYLKLVNGTPVTDIPFLDDESLVKYREYNSYYSGSFTYNDEDFNVYLEIDHILLAHHIRTDPSIGPSMSGGINYESYIEYGDSDTFYKVINNINKLSYNINGFDIILELNSRYTTVNIELINDRYRIRTEISNYMPLEEFLEKTKSVLESLTREIGESFSYWLDLASRYNTAMLCRTKRAL